MLQYGSVEPLILDVLEGLMQIPALKDFNLVGGTALALYFGHRVSVYLDLFSTTEFNNESLIAPLERKISRGYLQKHTQSHWVVWICRWYQS